MEELQLVDGLRQRSDAAVATFLERYRSLFYHCIGHFETDNSAREDLYQDLVLYALERLDRDCFDSSKGSFGTWLYRVAWCRCVDLKRREGARRRPRLATVGDDVPEREDEHPGPADEVEDGEMELLVRQALGELDQEERTLLDLRFIEGQTLGEIARQMSFSLEQTKYRLRRATIALRRVLLNQFTVAKVRE